MGFQSRIQTIKDGTAIKLRQATTADASHLVDLKRGYIKTTTTIPINLDEYPKNIENERILIQEYENSSNSLLLVAEHDNKLIGNIDLTGNKRAKMFHTGMVGMGISEKWRNQGLGRIFIESVIEWAKESSPIEIIWLDVYATNELGHNLYKNTGFVESGRIKDFFKDDKGYRDKIQMYQRIKARSEKEEK